MQTPTTMPEPNPSPIPQIIEESKELLVEGVTALDKSTHGWWKFAIILIVVGSVISAIAISTKYDPNQPHPKPRHDSACRLEGDTIICE